MKKTMPVRLVLCAMFIFVLSPLAAAVDEVDYRSVFNMVADPDTSYFLDYFPPSTMDNGQLWVDKTVSEDSVTFYEPDGDVKYYESVAEDEFIVTLSALSQGYSIESAKEPTDTVFILDFSNSMYVYSITTSAGSRRRSVVMTEALNDAIDTIMEANPNNRVAVVSYGGYDDNGVNMVRCYDLLKLKHYPTLDELEAMGAVNASGKPYYFQITTDGQTITINPAVDDLGMGTVAVGGATPTQMGIYRGAQVLMDNRDIDYTYETAKGRSVTLPRRPVMVLLTDGEPTLGWLDYGFEHPESFAPDGYTCGDGNFTDSIDMGIDLLTVLSAAYWKQQVSDYYFGKDNGYMHFYNIGLGVAGVHANSVMDPKNHAYENEEDFDGLTYNMGELLDQFTAGVNTVEFPVYEKTGSPLDVALNDVTNYDHYIKDWAYNDGYFPATDGDSLHKAFQNIALDIVSMGSSYPTASDRARPNTSGYLVISDPIGKYMRVKEKKGIWVNGEMHKGNLFASAIVNEAESGGDTMTTYLDVLTARLGVDRETAKEIILTSIAGGAMYYDDDDHFKASLRWYADYDTEFVGLYYDGEGRVQPSGGAACIVDMYPTDFTVSDRIAGRDTNTLYMYLSVATVLKDGMFGLKGSEALDIPLIAGQQLVHWYIPASLIPMRTVAEKHGSDNKVTGLDISKDIYPIRAIYTVTLDEDLPLASISDDYKKHNQTPDGKGYYFYSNDWRYDGADSYDTTLAAFEPDPNNPYYYFVDDTHLYILGDMGFEPAMADSPVKEYYYLDEYFDADAEDTAYLSTQYKPVDNDVTGIKADSTGWLYVPEGEYKSAGFDTLAKSEDTTESYSFARNHDYLGNMQLSLLGNNGRIEVSGFADLTVHKVWQGDRLPSAWVQLYADGVPYADPVRLNAANSWKYTWPEVMRYNTKISAANTTSPVMYTVSEGSYENGVFTPYDDENSLLDYSIAYVQPAWNEGPMTWSEAVITNRYSGNRESRTIPRPPVETPLDDTPSDPASVIGSFSEEEIDDSMVPDEEEPDDAPPPDLLVAAATPDAPAAAMGGALPQTGNSSNLPSWIALLLSGFAAALCLKRVGGEAKNN
ncbi:MAG: Cna B-type domain-containing protein [Clostridiales bacterium]|nr:Cna B-type domain-containing protein [Clostridiales bacterium]